MKNNKFLIITLLVLVVISAYYFLSKSSGTLSNELKDFAIVDTASIDKIFISDYRGEKVTLTRGDKYWVVDGAHKARQQSVEVLMTTFARIAIKSPVAKTAINNVIKDIATKTIKVEIYQGKDKPSKVYYIGGSTQDSKGTYMVLENDEKKSSVPFITHIPGFSGYLTTRFFANPLQWRDAAIFTYHPEEIKSIEIIYHETPEESFKLEKNNSVSGIGPFNLFDGQTTIPIQHFDTNKVVQYLANFEKIYYEMIVLDEKKPEQQDSIRKSNPFFTIKVEDVYGKTTKIVALHMNNYRNTLDDKGNPYPYDMDRMFAVLNDDILIYIQFYTFDRITLPKQFFLK